MKPVDPTVLREASHLVRWNEMNYGIITVKGFRDGEGWKKDLWSPYFIEYKRRRGQRVEHGVKFTGEKIELEISKKRIPVPETEIFEMLRQHNARIEKSGILIPENNRKEFPAGIRVSPEYQGSLCHVLVFSEDEYKIFLRHSYGCYTEIKYQAIGRVSA